MSLILHCSVCREAMMSARFLFSRHLIASQGCGVRRMLCREPPKLPNTETCNKVEQAPKPSDPAPEEQVIRNTMKHELETAKPYESMPKLPMVPIFGSAWLYFPVIGKYDSNDMFEADVSKQKKYGDVVREKFGPFEIVNSYHPMTNRILLVHEGRYPARAEFTTLKTYREARPEWYRPLGLVAMQGPEWEKFRLNVNPYVNRLRSYNQIIVDVAGDLVKLIEVERNAQCEISDLMELMSRWALESISCIALDTRLGCLNPNLGPESDGLKMIKSVKTQLACMNKLEASSGNFPFFKYFRTPTWKHFVKEADVFTMLVFKYILMAFEDYVRNKEKTNETTILQKMLLDARINVSGSMVAVADLIMAGIDTTAHTAGYLIYNLARNPEKQDRLYKEIKEWSEKESVGKPSYYEYCLDESFRLTPTIRGNLRVFDHDVVVHGYRVPAGVAVLCVQQVFARDERFYDKPHEFRPERYMDKDGFIKPFGVGKRSCIGQPLARQEIYALIKQVLMRYRLEYHYEEIKLKTRLINVPDRAIKVKFVER